MRHYRRAVMGGAGVYLAGVKAYLQGAPGGADWTDARSQRWGSAAAYVQRWGWLPGGRSHPLPLACGALKLNPYAQACERWTALARPGFTRFKHLPGVWGNAVQEVKVAPTWDTLDARNAPREYLAHFSQHSLNRIRSSSPRWRGTAAHRVAVRRESIALQQLRGWLPRTASRSGDERRSLANQYAQAVRRAGGPRAWGLRMVEMLAEGKRAAPLRRDVWKRLSAFAIYHRSLLRQVLDSFREFWVNTDSQAVRLFLKMTRDALKEAARLSRKVHPPREHRPPLRTVRPKPPSAPLAPPVL